MSTRTIHTHELVERLKQAGLDSNESKAIVDSMIETQQDLVTKQDLEFALSQQTNKLIMVLIGLLGLTVAFLKLF